MNDKNEEKEILELLVNRLNSLMKSGYTMEAVFLMGMYLEQKLSQIITLYEDTLRQTAREREIQFSPEKSRPRKIEKMSLGQLNSLFSTYNDSKEINDKLNEFIGFRNKIAHKLSGENLSTEIKVHTPTIQSKVQMWCTLISNLNKVGRELTAQRQRKIKRFVLKRKQ